MKIFVELNNSSVSVSLNKKRLLTVSINQKNSTLPHKTLTFSTNNAYLT